MSDPDLRILGPDEVDPAAPPIDNAADDASIRRKRRRVLSAAEKSDEFWAGVMSTETGRAEMWNLINGFCHAFEAWFGSAPNGAPDHDRTLFSAGKQEVGRKLVDLLMFASPDGTMQMFREHSPGMIEADKRRGKRAADGRR